MDGNPSNLDFQNASFAFEQSVAEEFLDKCDLDPHDYLEVSTFTFEYLNPEFVGEILLNQCTGIPDRVLRNLRELLYSSNINEAEYEIPEQHVFDGFGHLRLLSSVHRLLYIRHGVYYRILQGHKPLHRLAYLSEVCLCSFSRFSNWKCLYNFVRYCRKLLGCLLSKDLETVLHEENLGFYYTGNHLFFNHLQFD